MIKRARANLRTCIAQNEKRIIYPELFSQTSALPVSPLHWNHNKFSKRDLIELATALDASNAILDDKGKPAPFSEIISAFESLFNITLPRPYKERDYILQRKKCVTDFTARMVRAISEKSETKL